LSSDANNCGSCGTQCAAANGVAACSNSTCGLASCNAGYGNCDGTTANGCETSVSSNVNNCGSCGKQCTAAHGVAACSNSTCGLASCYSGYGNCDGIVANGCETLLLSNINNCGSCGTQCSAANGFAACSNGTCAISACYSGYANCNGNLSDGCETFIVNDPNNCGACGNQCSWYQNCSNGSCVLGL
jgi:hypothetical protein